MWTNESYPADAVSLRSVSSDNFVIVDTTHETRVIGETDFTSGPSTLHPKAIYIVEGTAVSRSRGSTSKGARRSSARSTATTTPTRSPIRRSRRSSRHVREQRVDAGAGRRTGLAVARRSPCRLAGCRVQEDQVLHERERRLRRARSARAADAHDVVLADDPGRRHGVLPYASDDRRDGVVGLAFAMRQVAQLLLMCDAPRHRHLDRQRRRANAAGERGGEPAADLRLRQLSRRDRLQRAAVPHARRAARETRQLIADCECEHGCPGCVGPIGNTGPLAKAAALRILDLLSPPRRRRRSADRGRRRGASPS